MVTTGSLPPSISRIPGLSCAQYDQLMSILGADRPTIDTCLPGMYFLPVSSPQWIIDSGASSHMLATAPVQSCVPSTYTVRLPNGVSIGVP